MAKTKLNLSLRQWIVLLSSFLVSGLGIGFFFVFGQLFVGIRNTFNSTTAETVVVQSVTIAVMHVTAMPNGALTNKYGPRTVGVVGTALTCFGFMASFFSTSLGFLAVMVGFFVASGLSAVRVSSAVAINDHFRGSSARPLAMSFISAGTSVGGMAYPYFIQYLRILSEVSVAGMFATNNSDDRIESDVQIRAICQCVITYWQKKSTEIFYYGETFALRGSLLMIGAVLLHTLPCALLWSPPEKAKTMSVDVSVVKMSQGNENRNMTQAHSEITVHELPRSTSTYAEQISDDKDSSPRISCEDNVEDNTKIESSTTKDSLIEVLTDRVFVTFCFASCLSFSGLSVFLIFIVDLFLDKGFSEYDAALALLLMNVSNLIGRLLPGILMRLPCVTALLIPALASLLGAILVIAVVFAVHLNLLLFLSVGFGLVLGIVAATFTVTTASLVEATNYANALGVLLAVIGIGSSTTGPINGAIRDNTGSYVLPFMLSSSSIFIAFLLYCIAQFWRKKLRSRTFRMNIS